MLPPFMLLPKERAYHGNVVEDFWINPCLICDVTKYNEDGGVILTMASAEQLILNFDSPTEFINWMKAYKHE